MAKDEPEEIAMLPARLAELNKHTRGSNEEVVGCAKKHAALQGEKREEIARVKRFWLTSTAQTAAKGYWTSSLKFVKDDEAKGRKTYATIYSRSNRRDETSESLN